MNKNEEKLFRMFTSSREEDVISFYMNFNDSSQLISFLSRVERDRGRIDARIKDEKMPTVICPTVSSSSDRASRLLDIFHKCNVIFIESGAGNVHFNYSVNCNLGIEYALKNTASEWIIVTNDDVRKFDPPDLLLKELDEMKNYDVLFAGFPSRYHSYRSMLLEKNAIYRAALGKLIKRFSITNFLLDRFSVDYIPVWVESISPVNRLSHLLMHRKIGEVINFGSFGIFSREFVENNGEQFFDTAYWNGVEDIDLSIRIAREGAKTAAIKFRLADEVGGSLGRGRIRYLRNIANYAILNTKFPAHEISGFVQVLGTA